MGKAFIKEMEGYYIDEYLNTWSKSKFSFAEAREASANLRECYGCENCIGCVDCRKCVDCDYCGHCDTCSGCESCAWCTQCVKCANCVGCLKCTECANCKTCAECTKCNGAHFCNECSFCNTCSFIDASTNCFLCRHSQNLQKCNGCYYCRNLNDCMSCTHIEGYTGVKNNNRRAVLAKWALYLLFVVVHIFFFVFCVRECITYMLIGDWAYCLIFGGASMGWAFSYYQQYKGYKIKKYKGNEKKK